jgi:hypothetical protein
VLDEAIAALPPKHRRRLMVTADGAGASHGLITRLDQLAAQPGRQLVYSVGWELGKREKAALAIVPETAWQIAVNQHGGIRERRADHACTDRCCAHRRRAYEHEDPPWHYVTVSPPVLLGARMIRARGGQDDYARWLRTGARVAPDPLCAAGEGREF